MDKRGNLQNVGYPVFFTPGAIAKLSFICDGEVTKQSPKIHGSSVNFLKKDFICANFKQIVI